MKPIQKQPIEQFAATGRRSGISAWPKSPHRPGHQGVETTGEEPKRDVRLEIVRRQLKLWHNTLYEAKVQARVARAVDNEGLAAAAAQNVEQAIRAIDELTGLMGELLNPEATGPDSETSEPV